ncbi:hypothetical protein T492DRAFT_1076241 [Pavlovales sp. CCMP2436]|nr:hypothetical protein T492DRAFT_1076241 [Pavlovales sp. CCMP2436]|mmetsp:Transcript_5413/g.14166  ORF Transcript_5413/g.14166 Transcript_5413/m.14166 type:complete len:246 (-) Transcript_5413:122-859(-)
MRHCSSFGSRCGATARRHSSTGPPRASASSRRQRPCPRPTRSPPVLVSLRGGAHSRKDARWALNSPWPANVSWQRLLPPSSRSSTHPPRVRPPWRACGALYARCARATSVATASHCRMLSRTRLPRRSREAGCASSWRSACGPPPASPSSLHTKRASASPARVLSPRGSWVRCCLAGGTRTRRPCAARPPPPSSARWRRTARPYWCSAACSADWDYSPRRHVPSAATRSAASSPAICPRSELASS